MKTVLSLLAPKASVIDDNISYSVTVDDNVSNADLEKWTR